MVKIPSLEDLKKAAQGLVDQAKNVDISGMSAKMKSGFDQVTHSFSKGEAGAGDTHIAPEAIRTTVMNMRSALVEFTKGQLTQDDFTKRMSIQLDDLDKLAAPVVVVTPPPNPEEPK